MKVCPKCNLNLPEEAHFCPKCMYRYPRTELVSCENKSKSKKRLLVIASVTIVLCIVIAVLGVLGFLWAKSQIQRYLTEEQRKEEESNTNHILEENADLYEEVFEDGSDVPYKKEITYDMRDCLTDYETVKQSIVENPILEFDIDEDGIVQSIYIDYRNADEESKNAYGFYGINGLSTRSEVEATLGFPAQNYGGTEYHYKFSGLSGTPNLIIAFDETGTVSEMQYYKIY